MFWSKLEMKFLCCNQQYSKHISFLQSVSSCNSTLLQGLQPLLNNKLHGWFPKPLCYFWLSQKIFTRGFANGTGYLQLTWQTSGRVLWIPPPPAHMLSEELPRPEKTDFPPHTASTDSEYQKHTAARRLVPDGQHKRAFCKGLLLHWSRKSCASNTNELVPYQHEKENLFSHLNYILVNSLPPDIIALLLPAVPLKPAGGTTLPHSVGSPWEWGLVSVGCDQPGVWQALAKTPVQKLNFFHSPNL